MGGRRRRERRARGMEADTLGDREHDRVAAKVAAWCGAAEGRGGGGGAWGWERRMTDHLHGSQERCEKKSFTTRTRRAMYAK